MKNLNKRSKYLWLQTLTTSLKYKSLRFQMNSMRSHSKWSKTTTRLLLQQRILKKKPNDLGYREDGRQQLLQLQMESKWDLKSRMPPPRSMNNKRGNSWGIGWLSGRPRKRQSITYSKRVKMNIAVRDGSLQFIELFTSAFSEKFIRISFEDESKKSVLIIEYNQSYIEVMGIFPSRIYQGASHGAIWT